MDVTRRCDYACRILRAAYKSGEAYVSVSDIAEQEDIPYAFARSIQHDLVKGGLIKTVRGARGGLALNCDPAAVTLLEVLEAIFLDRRTERIGTKYAVKQHYLKE